MLEPDNNIARRAESYCQAHSPPLSLPEELGFGQDGHVWATSRDTALKVFEREENYTRELNCYKRLAEREISEIDGFSIPDLVDFDNLLLVVEMSIVFPPFLIDFGKSYLDRKPDFDESIMVEFWQTRRELFEDEEWPVVQGILSSLQSIGIYYLDAKPGNIRFR